MSDFNTMIIEQFRANGGYVEANGFGSRLLLVHSIGAKSGQARISPLMALAQDDGSWLIAASKAGAPDNPAWYANLLAHPETDVEVPTAVDGPVPGGAVDTVSVRAVSLQGSARDAAWAQFTSAAPGFADYQERAGSRVIPVVQLIRR
ncbi:nitroreductase/quinone reductase family protein [Herbiconiux sp.]|uniref:nitroreductase/quinone reductase family protein n=1 Tax=Herbiconiux sp. TaxID=1871186 RepID=UPI0025C64B30|nr:nitroreductase/quinone reductase family protein [Herbiconiux sp.]